jgi:protein import protein ZIM17
MESLFFIFGRKKITVCWLEHGTEKNWNEFELGSSGLAGTSPKQVGAQKVSNSNAHILVPPQCSLLQSLSQEEARSLILQSALLGIKEWKTARSEVHEVPTYSIQGPTSCASDVDHLLKKMPMPILYQLPRRRIRVAFTCTFCQQHNTRGINPHNYIDGTIFVQCRSCGVFHNLKLFHMMEYQI